MRAIDISVLVPLITRDDSREVASAEAFIRKGARVSILALTEAMWVLESVYDRPSDDIATAIEMLLNDKDLILQDSEIVAAALALFRSRLSVGFSDCLMLKLARQAGHLPLGTFDRGLAKLEGTQRL